MSSERGGNQLILQTHFPPTLTIPLDQKKMVELGSAL